MTPQQKSIVQIMRRNGESYARIAESLGLSVNTVKSFMRRCTNQDDQGGADDGALRCPRCGEAYQQPPNSKPKRFCSNKCRQAWWYANRALSPATPKATCAHCGGSFPATRGQKYCCHACYICARFGGAAHV